MRKPFHEVLTELQLPERLLHYEATIIGTPPLGVDIESSDIDIACTANDPDQFKSDTARLFGHFTAFRIADLHELEVPAVRATFTAGDWTIDLFCQAIGIDLQHGVRHFRLEQRLLRIRPGLREQVLCLRKAGLKTEPAFAKVLGLDGDPYAAMLGVENHTDAQLAALGI